MRASVIVLACTLAARAATAEPSNTTLIAIGIGAAPVDYIAGVTLHEGSHALAAKLVGADVDELHVFPPGTDPRAHKFRFGWTYVHGLRSRGDRAFFYIAPKLTDTLLLGGLSAIIATSAWPQNRYAQLAITVGATGLWVDFAKDLPLLSPLNDVSQFERVSCMRGWRRAMARSVYGLTVAGLAVPVVASYYRTFSRSSATMATPLVVPLIAARF